MVISRRPLALGSLFLMLTASTVLAQGKEPQPRKLSNDEKKDLQAISTMLNGSGALALRRHRRPSSRSSRRSASGMFLAPGAARSRSRGASFTAR